MEKNYADIVMMKLRRKQKMAKGSVAKNKVAAILQKAFGEQWIGENGGKYYVWADDGGEQVQIAIGLTCPKTQVDTSNLQKKDGGFFFGESAAEPVKTTGQPAAAEITQEERDNIAKMLERLGL